MSLLVLFGTFFLFMVIGLPVVFSMGLSTVVFLVVFGQGLPLTVIPHQMVAGLLNVRLITLGI